MAFNLRKFAATVPEIDAGPSVLTGLERAEDTFKPDETVNIDDDQVVNSAKNKEQESVLNQARNLPLIQQLQTLLSDRYYAEIAPVVMQQPEIKNLLEAQDLSALRAKIDEMQLGPTVQQFDKSQDRLVRPDELKNYLDRIRSQVETARKQQEGQQQQRQQLFPTASRYAQVAGPEQVSEIDKGRFVEEYLTPLISYRGDKGHGDAISEQAKQEILDTVSPALEEDANSALEEVQTLDPRDHARAVSILERVFDNFIAPAAIEPSNVEQPVMSKHNPKGIIKFNLSDHILNNTASNQDSMIKTARSHSNDAYLLYGPTEKRVCPKLRGKNVGDVVSEYICRHHCLDGIVIDDNKTICGEALWRAHSMDKFSREYVDADGNIEGGYINKRFEVNRNVPEENKMRLKPGETRKPRPASIYGNLEARMQEMREKEGEKRGYKPETDTSKPFEWCHDQDQNNVEVDQAERNRREEAAGHKLVQYTNKNKSENKPTKQAQYSLLFALEKEVKDMIAGGADSEKIRQYLQTKVNPEEVENWMSRFFPQGNQPKAFNLKQHKQAQLASGPMGLYESSAKSKTKTAQMTEDMIRQQVVSMLANRSSPGEVRSYLATVVAPDQIDKFMNELVNTGQNPQTPNTGMQPMASGKFNIRMHKKAQGANIPIPEDGRPIEPKEKKHRKDDDFSREDLAESTKSAFNLKLHKEAGFWDESARLIKGIYYSFKNFLNPNSKNKKINSLISDLSTLTSELVRNVEQQNLNLEVIDSAKDRIYQIRHSFYDVDLSGDFGDKERMLSILSNYERFLQSLQNRGYQQKPYDRTQSITSSKKKT